VTASIALRSAFSGAAEGASPTAKLSCAVGALISKEHLTEKSGNSLPLLMHATELPSEEFNVPKHVDSKASVLQKGTNWIIMASGGVQIEPWQMIEKSQASEELSPLRTKAAAASKNGKLDRAGVVAALTKTDEKVLGVPMKFDATGEIAGASFVIDKVTGGKFVQVFP
jgi:hypothetical protein